MGERPWWGLGLRILRPLSPGPEPRFSLETDGGDVAVRQHIASPLAFRGLLAPAECARAVEEAAAAGYQAADDAYGEDRLHIRRCRSAWLQPRSSDWLYERACAAFERANATYGFRLSGIIEPLMIVDYRAGDRFDWHLDVGPELSANRKISMSIVLDEEEDYDGGNLEFAGCAAQPGRLGLGTALVFPAYLAHRVCAVTRGRRRALVAFAYGPSFT